MVVRQRHGKRQRCANGRRPGGQRRVESLEVRRLLAGVPELVADIRPGSESSDTGWLTEVDGTLFFTAFRNDVGEELFKSDGTEAGTVLVKDLSVILSSSPKYLTNVDGTLFFAALEQSGANESQGVELWKSDGTAEGTVVVKDILQGALHSYPESLTNVDGTLFFVAGDGVGGRELWKSDGTAAGTTMVKDIRPGPIGSYPGELTNVDGTLFFAANEGEHGYELWKSDGTEAGTVLVKDIEPGSYDSYPNYLTNAGGTLFFSAFTEANGRELWKSDGTTAGTVLVKDLWPGTHPYDSLSYSSFPFELTAVGNLIYFSADDGDVGQELWKSDGTAAGTVLVKDINPGFYGSYPSFGLNVDGTLFFQATDDTHGTELWKSDGTAAGTVLVRDVDPVVTAGFHGSFPNNLTNVNGTVYLSAENGAHGIELWSSDGTTVGTVLVDDLRPGADSSAPGELIQVGGNLYFAAHTDATGTELWVVLGDGEDDDNDDDNGPVGGDDTFALFDPSPSAFFYKNTMGPGAADGITQFGPAGGNWVPLAGDWDGDGADSFGVFDPAASVYFLKNTIGPGPAETVVQFGPAAAGWTPIVGDWDGDGTSTPGLYDPATSAFFLKNTKAAGPADLVFQFGPAGAGWTPIVGDWDGDGSQSVGLYSGSGFFLKNSFSAGAADALFSFGPDGANWIPLAGDWDADGTDTVALFEPSANVFFYKNSSTAGPADDVVQFGPAGAGWIPLAGNWDGDGAPGEEVPLEGNTLLVTGGAVEPGADIPSLTNAQLDAVISAGLNGFNAAGLPGNLINHLAELSFEIVDLPGGALANHAPGLVRIDVNAAGYGWHTDAGSNPPGDRVDLLTAVAYGLGHELVSELEIPPPAILTDATLDPGTTVLDDKVIDEVLADLFG